MCSLLHSVSFRDVGMENYRKTFVFASSCFWENLRVHSGKFGRFLKVLGMFAFLEQKWATAETESSFCFPNIQRACEKQMFR